MGIMGSIVFLVLFIFPFWFIHIVKRVFANTYLWQIKEYRWDRMMVYLRERNVLKNYPTFIAASLSLFGLILSKYMGCRWLYLVILVGFGYYVYSTLVAATQVFMKKLVRPKISMRNFVIVVTALLLSLIPLIASYAFYKALYQEPVGEPTISETMQFFPERQEDNLLVIPLETATVVLFFLYLFAFDLALPALVAVIVFFSIPISSFIRKKK
jgi:hypothetical protein